MFDTYLGTTSGVYQLTDAGVEPLGLATERVSALHAQPDDNKATLLAGSYGDACTAAPMAAAPGRQRMMG